MLEINGDEQFDHWLENELQKAAEVEHVLAGEWDALVVVYPARNLVTLRYRFPSHHGSRYWGKFWRK